MLTPEAKEGLALLLHCVVQTCTFADLQSFTPGPAELLLGQA